MNDTSEFWTFLGIGLMIFLILSGCGSKNLMDAKANQINIETQMFEKNGRK